MIKITDTHSMDEYMDVLSTSLEIYMDDDRLMQAYEQVCYTADDYKALALLWLQIESAGTFNTLNPDNIIDYLLRTGVDLDKRFRNKKTSSYSLDMKKVVTPLIESGVAVELLTAYKEYRTYSSYGNFLRKLVTNRKLYQRTPSGRTIVKFPTHIEERDNLRVYYSDIAVVSVPKKYSNMITGPDDVHFIAWCDYPQADWRFAYNLFIRDSTNEAVMRETTDAYEGLARLVEGEAFDPVEFKEKRKEYKVHCLKVFYNSKDTSPVPSAIRDYFRSRPKYRRLLNDLGILYKFGLPIPCKSYFGYEQLIPEGVYPDAFVSKGLNTPIQTFTSHVVNETVMILLEKFWSLGYTKDDINIYYVRHDEPLFLFTKNILKDAWVFRECSEIYIPGFTPIHLDFHFGRYYQESDEGLEREVNNAIESSAHVYDTYSGGEEYDYWPFPTVDEVNVQFFKGESDWKIVVYSYRYRTHFECYSSKTEMDDALNDVMTKDVVPWLKTPEYLLVRSNGLSYITYVGENDSTLMKVIDKPDSFVGV